MTTPTRERVMDAALRLFADQGYDETPVGEIERAAGLAPRAGGFYRHFASKEAVLEAVLTREVESLGSFQELQRLLPLGDRRAELALLCRWALAELDRKAFLLRVLMREGDRLPALARRAKAEWIEPSYVATAAVLARYADASGRTIDAEAAAVVALGAIAQLRIGGLIFGSPARELTDARFVDAWVGLVTALVGERDEEPGAS
jgi:AcrR family transcriptional regulator